MCANSGNAGLALKSVARTLGSEEVPFLGPLNASVAA